MSRLAVRLVGDLDCSATTSAAIVLEGGASLDLAGYTITGASIPELPTIVCNKRCRVFGPGTVSGGGIGIAEMYAGARIQVRGATVRGALGPGIVAGKVDLQDASIVDNGRSTGGCGVQHTGKILRSTIANNGCGVSNRGRRKLVIVDSDITDNVPLPTAPVRSLFGVSSIGPLVIRRSTVTGHLAGIPPLGPRCDRVGCGDIVTLYQPPRLVDVECGTSVAITQFPVGTWALCADDDDFDRDGTPNTADGCDVDPTCALEDGDADGVADCCDNCPAAANSKQGDYDADGLGDVCDPDSDGDGTPNETDLCDLDRACALEDADGDAVGDCCDNCPAGANPDQANQDNDHLGDVCDNCPTVTNPFQEDDNLNGIGDACE